MRILTGVDLKVPGHSWIVERSNRVARLLGARVDLLFVMAGTESGHLARHLSRLKQLLELVEPTLRGDALCLPGTPVDVLVETASDYDMLVVGPREPGAIERLLLGSIAARVVRRNDKTAVLIPRGDPRPMDTPRILVGVDVHGPHPGRMVAEAGLWTQRLKGVLDAVYVVPRMPHIANAAVRARAEKEWLARHEPELQILTQLIEKHVEKQHIGEVALAHGEPESQLVERSEQYSVVMVGSLPRSGIAGLILGSVAEHVVRHADCDVLAVPTEAPA